MSLPYKYTFDHSKNRLISSKSSQSLVYIQRQFSCIQQPLQLTKSVSYTHLKLPLQNNTIKSNNIGQLNTITRDHTAHINSQLNKQSSGFNIIKRTQLNQKDLVNTYKSNNNNEIMKSNTKKGYTYYFRKAGDMCLQQSSTLKNQRKDESIPPYVKYENYEKCRQNIKNSKGLQANLNLANSTYETSTIDIRDQNRSTSLYHSNATNSTGSILRYGLNATNSNQLGSRIKFITPQQSIRYRKQKINQASQVKEFTVQDLSNSNQVQQNLSKVKSQSEIKPSQSNQSLRIKQLSKIDSKGVQKMQTYEYKNINNSREISKYSQSNINNQINKQQENTRQVKALHQSLFLSKQNSSSKINYHPTLHYRSPQSINYQQNNLYTSNSFRQDQIQQFQIKRVESIEKKSCQITQLQVIHQAIHINNNQKSNGLCQSCSQSKQINKIIQTQKRQLYLKNRFDQKQILRQQTNIKQLQQKNYYNLAQINEKAYHLQKLSVKIQVMQRQSVQYKTKYNLIQKQNSQYKENYNLIQKQINQLKKKYQLMNQKNISINNNLFQDKIKSFQNQIILKNSQINKFKNEIQQLNIKIIQKKCNQVEMKKKQVQVIKDLNQSFRQQKQQIYKLKNEELNQLLIQFQTKQKQLINQYKFKIQLTKQQIQTKFLQQICFLKECFQIQIQQKIKIINSLQQKYLNQLKTSKKVQDLLQKVKNNLQQKYQKNIQQLKISLQKKHTLNLTSLINSLQQQYQKKIQQNQRKIQQLQRNIQQLQRKHYTSFNKQKEKEKKLSVLTQKLKQQNSILYEQKDKQTKSIQIIQAQMDQIKSNYYIKINDIEMVNQQLNLKHQKLKKLNEHNINSQNLQLQEKLQKQRLKNDEHSRFNQQIINDLKQKINQLTQIKENKQKKYNHLLSFLQQQTFDDKNKNKLVADNSNADIQNYQHKQILQRAKNQQPSFKVEQNVIINQLNIKFIDHKPNKRPKQNVIDEKKQHLVPNISLQILGITQKNLAKKSSRRLLSKRHTIQNESVQSSHTLTQQQQRIKSQQETNSMQVSQKWDFNDYLQEMEYKQSVIQDLQNQLRQSLLLTKVLKEQLEEQYQKNQERSYQDHQLNNSYINPQLKRYYQTVDQFYNQVIEVFGLETLDKNYLINQISHNQRSQQSLRQENDSYNINFERQQQFKEQYEQTMRYQQSQKQQLSSKQQLRSQDSYDDQMILDSGQVIVDSGQMIGKLSQNQQSLLQTINQWIHKLQNQSSTIQSFKKSAEYSEHQLSKINKNNLKLENQKVELCQKYENYLLKLQRQNQNLQVRLAQLIKKLSDADQFIIKVQATLQATNKNQMLFGIIHLQNIVQNKYTKQLQPQNINEDILTSKKDWKSLLYIQNKTQNLTQNNYQNNKSEDQYLQTFYLEHAQFNIDNQIIPFDIINNQQIIDLKRSFDGNLEKNRKSVQKETRINNQQVTRISNQQVSIIHYQQDKIDKLKGKINQQQDNINIAQAFQIKILEQAKKNTQQTVRINIQKSVKIGQQIVFDLVKQKIAVDLFQQKSNQPTKIQILLANYQLQQQDNSRIKQIQTKQIQRSFLNKIHLIYEKQIQNKRLSTINVIQGTKDSQQNALILTYNSAHQQQAKVLSKQKIGQTNINERMVKQIKSKQYKKQQSIEPKIYKQVRPDTSKHIEPLKYKQIEAVMCQLHIQQLIIQKVQHQYEQKSQKSQQDVVRRSSTKQKRKRKYKQKSNSQKQKI